MPRMWDAKLWSQDLGRLRHLRELRIVTADTVVFPPGFRTAENRVIFSWLTGRQFGVGDQPNAVPRGWENTQSHPTLRLIQLAYRFTHGLNGYISIWRKWRGKWYRDTAMRAPIPAGFPI